MDTLYVYRLYRIGVQYHWLHKVAPCCGSVELENAAGLLQTPAGRGDWLYYLHNGIAPQEGVIGPGTGHPAPVHRGEGGTQIKARGKGKAKGKGKGKAKGKGYRERKFFKRKG